MLRLSAKLLNVTSSEIKEYPGDEQGNSIVVTGEGMAGKGETAQNYGLPGIISNPPNDDKLIVLTIGNLDLVLGSLNYQVDLPENQGETKVYSTDSEGAEKATLLLNEDGEHIFNGGSIEAARNGDEILIDATTDASFIAWITTVSAFINGLAPGTIPNPPTSIKGKINEGTSEVLLP